MIAKKNWVVDIDFGVRIRFPMLQNSWRCFDVRLRENLELFISTSGFVFGFQCFGNTASCTDLGTNNLPESTSQHQRNHLPPILNSGFGNLIREWHERS